MYAMPLLLLLLLLLLKFLLLISIITLGRLRRKLLSKRKQLKWLLLT
jgi:hypothetical protein